MVRGIARDVGAEVDEDVALVTGVIVVGVDAGNGVAKAAVLPDTKPGAGDDDLRCKIFRHRDNIREKKNNPQPQKAEGCLRCDYLNMTPALIVRVIGAVHFNVNRLLNQHRVHFGREEGSGRRTLMIDEALQLPRSPSGE